MRHRIVDRWENFLKTGDMMTSKCLWFITVFLVSCSFQRYLSSNDLELTFLWPRFKVSMGAISQQLQNVLACGKGNGNCLIRTRLCFMTSKMTSLNNLTFTIPILPSLNKWSKRKWLIKWKAYIKNPTVDFLHTLLEVCSVVQSLIKWSKKSINETKILNTEN